MKRIIITLITLLFAQISIAQSFKLDDIKFKGLSFSSTKDQIIKKLGKPKKEYAPNYECGFLSSEEQGKDYYTLDYGNFKFTGNEDEKYVIDEIDFQNDKSLMVFYKKWKLNSETKFKELVEIFGKKTVELDGNELHGMFFIQNANNDDGMLFEIKNGKLIRLEYWSPC